MKMLKRVWWVVAVVCVGFMPGGTMAQEKSRFAEVDFVFEAGVGEEKAGELKATFEKLIADGAFDIGEQYGKSRAFTFTVFVGQLRLVVFRSAKSYRVYMINGSGTGLGMVGPGGAIMAGEEGGKEVMNVVPDMGYSIYAGVKDEGSAIVRAEPETNPQRKGVFAMRVGRILVSHAAKAKRVLLKEHQGQMMIKSEGKESAVIVQYDLKERRMVAFGLLGPGERNVLTVKRFREVDPTAFEGPVKLPRGPIRVEGTEFILRGGGPEVVAQAQAAYVRLTQPENTALADNAATALGIYLWAHMQSDRYEYMGSRSLMDVEELAKETLDGRLVTVGALTAALEETAPDCRMAQMDGRLRTNEERKPLGQVLSHPLIGQTPALALRRQLLLADAFMTGEEMGVQPQAMSGVDALVWWFLEGAPVRSAGAVGGAYVEAADAPEWLKLLSRVDNKTLGAMDAAKRGELVGQGLDGLMKEGRAFLSTARVLSNVLKDAVVRKTVEEELSGLIEEGRVQAAERRLAMLLTEDAEPANREWLAGVMEKTMAGLRSKVLTHESVALLKAVSVQRGTWAAREAGREMLERPDPEGIVKADETGTRDVWKQVFGKSGNTAESVIEGVYKKGKVTKTDVYVVAAANFEGLPWKWRRELCRRLGLALKDQERNQEFRSALQIVLYRMNSLPDAFMDNARWAIKEHLLEGENAQWMFGSLLLFNDRNCQGLLKVTSAKNREGAAWLLRDKALVAENLEELRALVREVKVAEPVVWVEEGE